MWRRITGNHLFGGAGTGGMLNFFALDANGKTILQRLPDFVPINEAQVVQKFLLEHGLTPSPELSTRTVREVVALLTDKFLCVHTWELCGDGQLDVHGAKASAAHSGVATKSASGEIYMFEQCTLQVVKATTETLARRPEVVEGSDTTSQESTAGIPEGRPPSPTLTVTSSGVQDWSDQQVAAWLRDVLKFDDVADAVLAEGVDGAMVLEMDKDEWKELGTSGLKAAKIVSQLKKLV
eukprot:COSAG02_NODE_15162_length_1198_cov_1.003640_1_plen_237_part_00